MKDEIQICFILFICGVLFCDVTSTFHGGRRDDELTRSESESETSNNEVESNDNDEDSEDQQGCWMKVDAPALFETMEKIDNKYAAARKEAQADSEKTKFDDEMLKTMLKYRGAAQREIIKPHPGHGTIPAGMNLGGRCMIRLPDSVLFFHRMKLRNNTSFQIKVLHNDLENMVLRMLISLNDLHLKGAYERSMTDRDPAALIYSPSFGEIEILMKDVLFTVEGRYRLIKERLVIEFIISELKPQDILLTHFTTNTEENPLRIRKDNLGDFAERLKTDLNKWLQDYMNDYLIHYSLEKIPSIAELQKYDKQKSAVLARFMDSALKTISKRIRSIGGSSLHIPEFTIVAAYGVKLKLYDGLLIGLDTMYRRSVATTLLRRPNYRFVNSIIGFSNLKVVYKYEVDFPTGSPSPSLTGVIILTANDLMGHLALGLLKEPEVMEIDIDFVNQVGPNSLTVEGAANLMLSNFKHLLDHQITSIMANTVIYGVDMMKSLPRCEPFLPGQAYLRPVPKLIELEDRLDDHPLNTNMIRSKSEFTLGKLHKKRSRPQVPMPVVNEATSSISPLKRH